MAAPFIEFYRGGAAHAAPANFVQHQPPPNSLRTEFEGRNQHPILQPREERVIRQHPGKLYDGRTFQRLPVLPNVPAAEMAAHREDPDVRIPMGWWRTFLPNQITDRFTAAGAHIDHSPGNKHGPHYAQLEHDIITAPSYTRVRDGHGGHREVTVNAKPQLLYPKTNTMDRPANEKHCSYGKVRDPSTNSWRCLRNPNHHAENL